MLVPIACRFVPYDQWLITHLDDEWKVKQVKHWILSKCNLLPPGPRTHRSASPITFAPSLRSTSSPDSADDGYNEDDEDSDQAPPPRSAPFMPGVNSDPDMKSPSSSRAVQPGSSPLVDRYTLLSFSTGSILEDEFALSWYNLRPYELLEMHTFGIVTPLQRDILAEYIQPYFQARVKALRVVWNRRSSRFETPDIDIPYEHSSYMPKDNLAHAFISKTDRGRKNKANWRARWVVINQGTLFLCKESVTSVPIHQFALSAITALRGADALEHAFSVIAQPRVVCVKFRPRSTSLTGSVFPSLPPSPLSPFSEDSGSNNHEPFASVDATSDLKHIAEQDDSGERSGEHAYDPNDPCSGDGEWVILDMLNDHAFSSILRILHREACHPISSSFAPPSSIMAVSRHSPAVTSLEPYDTIPYPEWRMHTVENARKAGMGDVGKAMAWVLWSEKGLGGESLLGNIRHHRQAFLQEMQYKTTAIPFDNYGSDDDESDDDSEMEWEGWMRDLERRSRVGRRSGKAGRTGASRQVPVSSQLPSPPRSEASPTGTPRVRSPSPSGSFRSSQHGQYPNIGNIIGARGQHSYSMEKVQSCTVSTVSVGTAFPTRRRSSTISTGASSTTRHDGNGRHTRERFSSISVNSARTNVRAAGRPIGLPHSPGTPVRHTYSRSNLRTASSAHESDAAESPVHATPSSPSKRQSAFMRGMTLRAGKIVKGLESAADFVDEKTM